MSDVRIAVAAHKPYWMPDDPLYVPVQAGALGKDPIPGYRRDDEGGGGISALNPHLSELTVLWWAWKQLAEPEDGPRAVGLSHYRRQFAGSGERGVMTGAEAADLTRRFPVVLPKERNYRIETLGSHYDHTFSPEQIDLLMQVVAERAPQSSAALYRRLSGTRGHMFNMFVMRSDLVCRYCEWMFPIVRDLEAALDYAGMDDFLARTPGRLSEFLLDTWLAGESLVAAEVPVRDMEPVNWAKKGGSFLAAKFLGRKYAASF